MRFLDQPDFHKTLTNHARDGTIRLVMLMIWVILINEFVTGISQEFSGSSSFASKDKTIIDNRGPPPSYGSIFPPSNDSRPPSNDSPPPSYASICPDVNGNLSLKDLIGLMKMNKSTRSGPIEQINKIKSTPYETTSICQQPSDEPKSNTMLRISVQIE